jgi:hypothetical protein
MPEIKVECDCGQRYKFEVQPVNGRMPYPITCPVCGLDGTAKANTLLQQMASAPPPAPVIPTAMAAPASVAPAPASSGSNPVFTLISAPEGAAPAPAPLVAHATAPAPAPAMAAPPVPAPMAPPAVPGEKSKLRINIAHPSGGTAAPAAAQAPAAAPSPARRIVPGVAPAKKKALLEDAQPNLPLGIVGAVVGGFIGMMLWYWLIKVTEYKIGYAAWGVGVVTGLGARILGRAGTPVLGTVAGFCTLIAILGGQYMFAERWAERELGGMMAGLVDSIGGAVYDEQMKYAPEALKVQTDEEIKALYQKINESAPDAEELAEFKTTELQELKDMATGKLSKADYIKKMKGQADSAGAGALGFKERWELFKSTLDLFTIIFLLLGVTTAFKIGNG